MGLDMQYVESAMEKSGKRSKKMIKTDKVIYILHTESEFDWLLNVLDDSGCRWVNGNSLIEEDVWLKVSEDECIYICVQEGEVSWVREANIGDYKTFEFIETPAAILEYEEHRRERERELQRKLIIPVIKEDSPFDIALNLWKAKQKDAKGRYRSVFTIEEIKKIGQHLVNFATVEGVEND